MTVAMAEQLGVRVRVGAELRDFSSWMTAEQRRIYLLCRRMLQDADEADSATQDVFLKAYRALSRGDLGESDHAAKWVTRIAVNTCLDRLRSNAWKLWRRRPAPADEEYILASTPGQGVSAEERIYAKQVQQRLEVALQRLSDRQRAVFTLRHYDQLSLDEIAETLQLDSGTVKAHLFRAVTKLREELRDLYAPAEKERL